MATAQLPAHGPYAGSYPAPAPTTGAPTTGAPTTGAGWAPGEYATAAYPSTGYSDPAAPRKRGVGKFIAGGALAVALALGGGLVGALVTHNLDKDGTIAGTNTTVISNAPIIDRSSLASIAAAVRPSVVSITTSSAEGSGVVLSADGYILTNNHVAVTAQGKEVNITFADGRSAKAKLVGTDPKTDLAVFKANGVSGLTVAKFGDSAALQVGDTVLAIGSPLGLDGSVTSGIISALNRTIDESSDSQPQQPQNPFDQGNPGQSSQSTSGATIAGAIQTDAAINPGNSGGALVTADGKLIGINSSIASLGSSAGSQSGNIGIGFAIPVNEAKSIADQLIATGTAQHAYIGVSAGDTTVTDGNSKRQAALVQSVSQGTPAAQAGLQAQDAVIAIDGKPIDSSEALVANIHEHKVGDTVTITVIRGSQKQDIKVTLAARPG